MPYTHLTSRERYALEQLLLYGRSYREIGRRLGRHHSTIQRELERNGPSGHAGVYVGARGDRLARQRRCRAPHQRLFRRSLCHLAARRQREQQRPAAPIPAQRHRHE